jgi:hypothetical protein
MITSYFLAIYLFILYGYCSASDIVPLVVIVIKMSTGTPLNIYWKLLEIYWNFFSMIC